MEAFSTQFGRCVLDDESGELRLEADDWPTHLRRRYRRSRATFALLVGWLLFVGWNLATASLHKLRWVLGIALIAFGVLLGVARLRGYVPTDAVAFDAVTHVDASAGWSLTRPRFVVHYADDGRTRRLRFTLPARRAGADDDPVRGVRRAFESRGIRVE